MKTEFEVQIPRAALRATGPRGDWTTRWAWAAPEARSKVQADNLRIQYTTPPWRAYHPVCVGSRAAGPPSFHNSYCLNMRDMC